jgi:hypothetical protein
MSIRVLVIAGVALLALRPRVHEASQKLFDVTLEDVQGGGRVLNVGFYRKLPAPAVVDKILRESLYHATLIDSSVDILAMAFRGNEVLSSTQYSGSLVYKASEKMVKTFDDYRGVKTEATNTGSYFVETRAERTLEGVTPARKWLSVTIVFPKQPAREAAYDAIIAETRRLSARNVDINVYVSVGDHKVKASWKQMRDKDGAYVFAEYDAASRKLTRKDQLLKQLP